MKKYRKGFTIVELVIAMSFLAVLLITIAILVIRIVGIYQKGLSIRSVNSTGRSLIDDFSRTVSGSPISDVSDEGEVPPEKNRGLHKFFFENRANIEIDGTTKNVQTSGGFCTGTYTYLWNTAYAINSGEYLATYKYEGEKERDYNDGHFRLLKIPDPGREICLSHREPQTNTGDPNTNRRAFEAPTGQSTAEPAELLDASEDDLALYDLKLLPATGNYVTGHTFYTATFVLATLKGGIDITSQGDYCKEPTESLASDFNYCAINKFNFAMRATGETKGGDYGTR